jgi:hypothetical protein
MTINGTVHINIIIRRNEKSERSGEKWFLVLFHLREVDLAAVPERAPSRRTSSISETLCSLSLGKF